MFDGWSASTDAAIQIKVKPGREHMSAEANKALLRRYFTGLVSEGDLGAADELFAADYVTDWTIPDMPRGPGQVKFAWAEWRVAFPDWAATLEHQVAEGEWVSTRITAGGTHLGVLVFGPVGRLAPSGKCVRINGTVWARIHDGRIVEMLQDGDFLGLLQQLGALQTQSAPL
jgi:ketosteroid isomerase-like protein